MKRSAHPQLLLLCYCTGIVIVQQLPMLPPLWLVGLILPLLLLRQYLPAQILVALLAGFGWSLFVSSTVLSRAIPAELEQRQINLSGWVTGVPYPGKGFVRFDFKIDSLQDSGKSYPSPGTVRLRWYRPEVEIHSGQHWELNARLKQARGFQNPGGFDYETWLFQNRIRATGQIVKPEIARLLSGNHWRSTVDRFRERTATFIHEQLSVSDFAGMVTALAVGVRSSMEDEQWQVLQRTGTIHLLAISGLHIGLVAGLVFTISSFLWRLPGTTVLLLSAPRFAILVALLAGIGYAGLAGFSIPTRRAALMLATAATAMLLQRRPGSFEILLLVLAVVLTLDPLAPLAIGFWLSFTAVGVIVVAINSFNNRRQRLSSEPAKASQLGSITARLATGLQQWSIIQVALLVGLAPLLLIYFQRISLAAPLANLIAIPVVGMFVVPLALLGVFFFSLGIESLAKLSFHSAESLLNWLWPLLQKLSNIDWSVLEMSMPVWWTITLGIVGAAILFAPRGLPGRWTGLLWLSPMLFMRPPLPATGEMVVTVLEVGQGLSSVVQTRNHTLIYDTGPGFDQGFDAGAAVLIPFLRHQGIQEIDTLIVSHGDNDHIGGMKSLLQNIPVNRRLSSVPDKVPNSENCVSGQQWEWDGVSFEVLWPDAASSMRGNKASCVVKATSPHGSVLLTGDIERSAEYRLLKNRVDLHATLLQVPHHGSKTSSRAPFLDAVKPQLAVVSSGYLNRFKHPHHTVLRLYQDRNVTVQNTAFEGALRYEIYSKGINAESYRNERGRYWIATERNLTGLESTIAPKRKQ